MDKKTDFFRDKDWSRIALLILLAISLAFNYVLKTDNDTMTENFLMAKHGIYETIIGPNYCDKD